MPRKAYIHASSIITGNGVRAKDGRKPVEADLGEIRDGAIVFEYKKVGSKEIPLKIDWVGPTENFPKRYSSVRKTDLKLKRAIVPGFIDCHTHLVFAGDRSEEFAQRCRGVSYEEIAKKGGGIVHTMKATQAASGAELEALAAARVSEIASYGVRTIEIKSGYGLSVEAEIKSLEVIAKLKKKFPELTIIATFLGAHAFPPTAEGESKAESHTQYFSSVVNEMLPRIAKQKLADACDIFVDKGYFTADHARELLKKAKALGLKTKIHSDEFEDVGGTELAVELGALSADHLLSVSDENIKRLAKSNTVAVLLPGTAFYLKAEYAPARKLIDAGAAVALSTDYNPGSCMCASLPVIMNLAALYMGMSRAEILAAVTYNAAKALGLHRKKGTLEPGMDADFTVLPFKTFEETYYRFAWAPGN